MKQLLKHLANLIPIRLLAKSTSPIVLYHSIFEDKPTEFEQGLDNVEPKILYSQLVELKKYYKVVSLRDYIKLSDTRGYACVTFDDAYSNVIENGLKIFEELNIPVTIFVNTATLSGKVFWRDKVRYIINQNLVEEFEKRNNEIRINNKSFYTYTTSNRNNSIYVEKKIDNFIQENEISYEIVDYCVSSEMELINHPLVEYGNHTHNHYVMSSLTEEQQYKEIKNAKEVLENFDLNKNIEVFSLPFGSENDYDHRTAKIVKELGYKKILLSRNRLNTGKVCREELERFMPLESDILFTIKKLFLKKFSI